MTVERQIPVRRLEPLPDDAVGRHFAGGDVVMSHLVAVLSAMFPNGEDFFVRSVRNYRDELRDPQLRAQVKQFVGQESMHGRLHRELNQRLAELGYRSRLVDFGVEVVFNRIGAAVLPKSVQLAVTAALEHYTATLAEVLLSEPDAPALFTDELVRHLFLWHALEESEHKAVAFDVFEAVSGNETVRRAAMDGVTAVFLSGLVLGTACSAALDRTAWDLRRWVKGLTQLPRSPFFSRNVVRRLRRYRRPEFHPDQFDSGALLERWRTELFGEDGLLADRLKVGSAQ